MFRMAWRETRGAWRHFLYFFVCIAIGVSALVGVSLFAAHVEHAVSSQAKGLLGGDLEIRSSHPLSAESRTVLDTLDQRSVSRTHISELVAMAARTTREATSAQATQIVELKAVEPGYPLYGALKIEPSLSLDRLLHPDRSQCEILPCHGAVVQEALLLRMGLVIGDRFKIGKAEFLITGLVRTEPDRMANAFSLGPRVIISAAGLKSSALVQPGSRIRERELLRLPPQMPLEPLRGPPRLAVIRSSKWNLATEPQKANFEASVNRLREAGAQVRDVNLPKLFDDAWENVMTIMSREAVRSFLSIESRHRIRLSPHLIELLDRGHRVTPEQYGRARARRDEYRRWLDNLFERNDAIVTIPAVGEAPEGLASTGDASFAQLWTQAGMPAIAIPSGFGPRGLPLGIQIVGRYREDQAALEAAAWTEATLGFKPGLAGG